MIRKGIIIDTMKFTIVRECSYDDVLVEAMFYRVDGEDLIPAAYVYPLENKEELEVVLEAMRGIKKAYDEQVAHFYYKILPQLRITV